MLEELQFQKFDSIARLHRDVVITEKIDGMNCGIHIANSYGQTLAETGGLWAINVGGIIWHVNVQTRKRLINLGDDQYGFAAWVFNKLPELVELLGPGSHYGEWWGKRIQRSYHQPRNYFSLFNTKRWTPENTCHIDGLQVVPVLYEGMFSDEANKGALERLRVCGSVAARLVDDRKLDFRAEGIVGWHTALNMYYKITLDGDGHKGAAAKAKAREEAQANGFSEFAKLIGIE